MLLMLVSLIAIIGNGFVSCKLYSSFSLIDIVYVGDCCLIGIGVGVDVIVLGIGSYLNDLEVRIVVNYSVCIGICSGGNLISSLFSLLSRLCFLSLLLFSVSQCKELCDFILLVILSLLLLRLDHCEKLFSLILSLSLSVGLSSLLLKLLLLGRIDLLNRVLSRCFSSLCQSNDRVSRLCLVIRNDSLGSRCIIDLELVGILFGLVGNLCDIVLNVRNVFLSYELRIVVSYCCSLCRISIGRFLYKLRISVSRSRCKLIYELGLSCLLCILGSLLFSLCQFKKLSDLCSSLCLLCRLFFLSCSEKLSYLSLSLCLFFLTVRLIRCKKLSDLSSSCSLFLLARCLSECKHFINSCSSVNLGIALVGNGLGGNVIILGGGFGCYGLCRLFSGIDNCVNLLGYCSLGNGFYDRCLGNDRIDGCIFLGCRFLNDFYSRLRICVYNRLSV